MLWTRQKKMRKLKILKKALRVKLVSEKNCKKTDSWKMFPSAVKFSQSDIGSCIITCRTEENHFLWSWCRDGWKQTSASKCFTSCTYCCFISLTRHPQIFYFQLQLGIIELDSCEIHEHIGKLQWKHQRCYSYGYFNSVK